MLNELKENILQLIKNRKPIKRKNLLKIIKLKFYLAKYNNWYEKM